MQKNFEPEITVLYCGHSLAAGDYLPEGTKKGRGFKARFVMMPCSSKVEVGYLVRLIEEGRDGVVLAACTGEHCQFMLGHPRSASRVKYAQSLLDEAGIDASRLVSIPAQEISGEAFMSMAEKQAESVRALGPNPMKDSKE